MAKNDSFKVINDQKIAIRSCNFDGFEALLHKQDDTLRIINFWATWCKPCVKELPAFERVAKEFSSEKVKVIFVSLDFPEQMEHRLVPFVKERKLENVILLDDPKSNTWIPKVDESWSGAIPATLIYKKDQRDFYESGFDYSSLKNAISDYGF